LKLLILLIFSITLLSCQESSELTFNDTSVVRSNNKFTGIDFNIISKKVLIPHCIECHKEYSNYNNVYRERHSILKSILNNKMPEDKAPLSRSLKKLVNDWVKAGAVGVSAPTNSKLSTAGLSKLMKSLYAKHSETQPILDNETKTQLSTKGAKVEESFGTQNKAQLQYHIGKTKKLVTRIDMIDSTCKEFKKQTCLLVTHVQSYKKRMSWVNHTDMSRLNQIVEFSRKDQDGNPEGEFRELEEDSFHGANMAVISPRLNQNIKDYLICENWSDITNELNLKILSWNAEMMLANSETGMNENRTIGGLYNMKLTKFNKYIYQLSMPEFVDSRFRRQSLIHLLGESGSIHLEKKGNQQCMIGYKLDYNSLVSGIRALVDQGETEFKAYHIGQDNTFVLGGPSNLNDDLQEAIKGVVR
jgi:hypothetical protein